MKEVLIRPHRPIKPVQVLTIAARMHGNQRLCSDAQGQESRPATRVSRGRDALGRVDIAHG